MRWALVWLGIGFLWKWFRECVQGLKERWQSWKGRWGTQVFDAFLIAMSFALVYALFGVLHVTTWQAFWVFVFWSVVTIVIKEQ